MNILSFVCVVLSYAGHASSVNGPDKRTSRVSKFKALASLLRGLDVAPAVAYYGNWPGVATPPARPIRVLMMPGVATPPARPTTEGSDEERALNTVLLQEALTVQGSNEKFHEHKNQMLQKTFGNDKSPKGCVDRRIVDILREFNRRQEYVTTSSCSGRVYYMSYLAAPAPAEADSPDGDSVIVPERGSKVARLCVSHDGVLDAQAYFDLDTEPLSNHLQNLWLKVTPFSMHVACASPADANHLVVTAARIPGVNARILAPRRDWRTIVELEGNQRLEMPFALGGQAVYSGSVSTLSDIVNTKLNKNWDRMVDLLKELKASL